MKRTIINNTGRLLAVGLVAVGLLAGTASAGLIGGTPGSDVLRGTPKADKIIGGAGNDIIRGGAGNDKLDGGPGDDVIYGGPGADRIECGTGRDVIYITKGDWGKNTKACEDVRSEGGSPNPKPKPRPQPTPGPTPAPGPTPGPGPTPAPQPAPAPAKAGKYLGTTTQNERITVEVDAAGQRVMSLTVAVNESCQPANRLSLYGGGASGPVNITIGPDGRFSHTITFANALYGMTTFTIDGRFDGVSTVAGTLTERSSATYNGTRFSCQSGTVNWSANLS